MAQASFTVKKTPMITEVTMSNFKGIKKCEIKDISRVNLFIGKNDCGKSSIIEAIYFTCKEYVGPNLPTCIRRRSNRAHISSRELWYEYNTDPKIEIALTFKNQDKLKMTIGRDGGRISAFLEAEYPSTKWAQVVTEYDFSSFVSMRRRGIPHPLSVELTYYMDRALLLDSLIITNLTVMEGNYLTKVKLSGEDIDLANRHADMYGKEARWEFVPHPDYSSESRVILYENGKRVFLEDFGDGPRYGLAICSSAKTIRDTAMLIEEIESHQHPGSLRKLIKHLIEISKDNNLQLFITTHSYDVYRFLRYYYEDPEVRKKEFRCFHVIRDARSGKVDVKPEENIDTIRKDIFEIEYSS